MKRVDAERDSCEYHSMLTDLEKPMFTQKQLLRLLPDMKPKTLQNWAARGILDVGEQKPGRQGKRLYSPLDVIILGFMHEVGLYGIPPLTAKELAGLVAEEAVEYWRSGPTIVQKNGDSGSRLIPIHPDKVEQMRRAVISAREQEDGRIGYYMYLPDSVETHEFRFQNKLSIVFELHYHIAMAINQMFLLEAGLI